MPGQLKRDAICPMCRRPLEALADETRTGRVRRTFYHERDKNGRDNPCFLQYSDMARAAAVRKSLEVEL